MPSDVVHAYQAGAPDANGQPPEHNLSDGPGNPCRHCLTDVAPGAPMLILAYRPFPGPQPYAEVGPIFLHAEACGRYDATAGVTPMLRLRRQLLVRGHGGGDRILYGTDQVIGTADLKAPSPTLRDPRPT